MSGAYLMYATAERRTLIDAAPPSQRGSGLPASAINLLFAQVLAAFPQPTNQTTLKRAA